MELPRIFRASKLKMRGKLANQMVRGFTLIEILLAVGIIAVIAALSIGLSLPILSDFTCKQEVERLGDVFQRARFLAQLFRVDVVVEIEENSYGLYRSTNGVNVLLDGFERNPSVPVVANDEIVFRGGDIHFFDSNISLLFGSENSPCQKLLQINRFGVVSI